jgi:uncharacterized protein (DUF1330 family)|tara:strand:- start:143 stop:487 length:345 start_codon:yes stop_codon:yes gene_type:complete
MKKITISIALFFGVLIGNAQDTTCTMVTLHKVFKFNFYTSEVVRSFKHVEGSVFIDVGYNVECLHLWDGSRSTRKVVITYDDGEVIEQVVDSKDNSYYIVGPARIEVKTPKIKR